ncbi:hypothetical protein PanWU01x14_236010, partial [Parasponia andersonii]
MSLVWGRIVAGIVAGDENSEMFKNGIFLAGEHGGFAGPVAGVAGGTVRQRRPVGRSDEVRGSGCDWSRSSAVSEEEKEQRGEGNR